MSNKLVPTEYRARMYKISTIKPNPDNPRVIKDEKYKKLVKSIKDFPKMLYIRPLVIDKQKVVLGGNMRLKALKDLGYKEVPAILASDLNEDEEKEFIVKDNIGYGDWDWLKLGEQYSLEQLEDWGQDIPEWPDDKKKGENPYSTKILAPTYEPQGEKPELSELVDQHKANSLIEEIEQAKIPEDLRNFLKLAAGRHNIFNYENIANYYAYSDAEVQDLMEKCALVIIDFNKAIEYGYTKLTDKIVKLYQEDYGKAEQEEV